jgi:hypothetical protein
MVRIGPAGVFESRMADILERSAGARTQPDREQLLTRVLGPTQPMSFLRRRGQH